MEQYKEINVQPSKETIPEIAGFVEQTLEELECPMKIQTTMLIITDEIFSNLVYYSQATEVTVKVGMETGVYAITFTDNGIPYNPLEAKTPDITLSAEERSIGGLGMHIVKKMADEVTYQYEDAKNILNVKKHI